MKNHSISMYQDRYATSIVAKYLDNATVKVSTKFYNTIFSADMIFTKEDVSTSDEQSPKYGLPTFPSTQLPTTCIY